MPEQFVQFEFTGGLNVDIPAERLSDKELTRADNAVITQRGTITKRFGVDPINSDSYDTQVEQVMDFPRKNGDKEILAIIGDELCKVSGDSKDVITTVSGEKVPHFVFQDDFYFIDDDEYWIYDGDEVNAVDPADEDDNDLSPIRKCKYALRHPKSRRIFFAGDPDETAALYYSEPAEPDYVKEASQLFPTTNDGNITGLEYLMDSVVVSYEYNNYYWMGYDPQDATWGKMPVPHGAYTDYTMEMTLNTMTYLSRAGIIALSPAVLNLTATMEASNEHIRNLSKNRVLSILKEITDPKAATAVYDRKNERYMLAFCDDGSGRNNKVLVYDWTHQNYTLWTGLHINDFCSTIDGRLLAATENYIVEMNETTEDITDDGSDKIIDFDVKTTRYNFGAPFTRKKLQKLHISFRNFGEDHEIEVDLIVDDEVVANFMVSGDDSDTEIITFRKPITVTGNNFQFRFRNEQYSKVEIYGIGFKFVPAPSAGDKVE